MGYSVLSQRGDDLYEKRYVSELEGCVPITDDSIVTIYDTIGRLSREHKKIVVFAFDAVGYDYFCDNIALFLPEHADIKPLTSVFPSTTASAWPSIITGTLPAQHGVYGTSFKLREYEKTYIWISNTLNHGDERSILENPVRLNMSYKPTIFEALSKKGWISYYNGSHGQGVANPMRTELTRGAICYTPSHYSELKYQPQRLINVLLEKTNTLLSQGSERVLVWNYCDIDDYIHERGYDSLSAAVSWKKFVEDLIAINNSGAVIVILSDHGQISQHQCTLNWLSITKNHPWLKCNTGGAGRTLFFYPKKDKIKECKRWLENAMGDSAIVLTRREAFERGLFIVDEKDATEVERIGEIIAIAKTPCFVSAGSEYVSEHGGLTKEEMIVPLVVMGEDNG